MWGRKGKQTLPAAQQDHPRDKLGDGDGDMMLMIMMVASLLPGAH